MVTVNVKGVVSGAGHDGAVHGLARLALQVARAVGRLRPLTHPAFEFAKAARSAPLDGRPLFAANLAQPWPDEPLAKLWHAVTLLGEQRGDGHVAVLASSGITGRESNVLHAAAGRYRSR